jgi:hypothetical protein
MLGALPADHQKPTYLYVLSVSPEWLERLICIPPTWVPVRELVPTEANLPVPLAPPFTPALVTVLSVCVIVYVVFVGLAFVPPDWAETVPLMSAMVPIERAVPAANVVLLSKVSVVRSVKPEGGLITPAPSIEAVRSAWAAKAGGADSILIA